MPPNGILNLYVSHASAHIAKWERARKTSKISRAQVELELLTEIDRAMFPVEYKMAWYSTILTSQNFESFWLSHSLRLKLPLTSTKRYTPNDSLLEYDAPSPSSSEGSSPPGLTDDHETPSGDNATPALETQEDESDYIDPEGAAYARLLGGDVTPSPAPDERVASSYAVFDTRALLGDPNGLGREAGDDGEWGDAKKKTKARPRSKTPKVAKSGAVSKERKTPAKARTPKPKRDVGAVVNGVSLDGGADVMGGPVKELKQRQRRQTVKAMAMVAGQG